MAATHVSSTHRKRAIEDLAMTDEKPREVEVLVLGLSRTGTFCAWKSPSMLRLMLLTSLDKPCTRRSIR